MTAQPLSVILDRPGSCPINLEHAQARAAHLHAMLVQILGDGEFDPNVVRSLPTLGRVTEMDAAAIYGWSDALAAWWTALPTDVQRRISSVNVTE